MPEVDINLLAVLVAAVINMAVGMVWYSPVLFGSVWLAEIGKKPEEIGDGKTGYVIATFSAIIMAYVLAHFVQYVGATSLVQGVQTGLWAGLGFVATTFATEHVFNGKTLKLYFINAGYHVVSLVLMGGLLAVWQ